MGRLRLGGYGTAPGQRIGPPFAALPGANHFGCEPYTVGGQAAVQSGHPPSRNGDRVYWSGSASGCGSPVRAAKAVATSARLART